MPAQSSHSTQGTFTDLHDLPSSAPVVPNILEYEGDSTYSELAEIRDSNRVERGLYVCASSEFVRSAGDLHIERGQFDCRPS